MAHTIHHPSTFIILQSLVITTLNMVTIVTNTNPLTFHKDLICFTHIAIIVVILDQNDDKKVELM